MGWQSTWGHTWLREHVEVPTPPGGRASLGLSFRPAQPQLAVQEQGFSAPKGQRSKRSPGKEIAELTGSWGKLWLGQREMEGPRWVPLAEPLAQGWGQG